MTNNVFSGTFNPTQSIMRHKTTSTIIRRNADEHLA